MKYKITISTITEKKVMEDVYLSDEERAELSTTNRYAKKLIPQDVTDVIYTQTTNSEIDLKGIIDAFNKQPLAGKFIARNDGGVDVVND